MNIPFQYVSISRGLIESLCEMVLRDESIVVLGSRYSGKRHLLFRIQECLSKKNISPIVRLKCFREPPASTEAQVRQLIHEAVAEVDSSIVLDTERPGLLSAIEQLHERTGKVVILIASNVDGMAYHLARRFLTSLRVLAERGSVIAILTGEDDFRDLVYGPNSEFTCANQFVLQAFGEDEFNSRIDSYLGTARRDEISEEERRAIWKLTGGNTHLMRLVLWSRIEQRTRSNGSKPPAVDEIGIPKMLQSIGVPGVFGRYIFMHAVQLMARDQSCWPDLQKLTANDSVRVSPSENAPTRLELAGIAVRDGNKLRFASELMRDFSRQYYDNRRWGDLYASHGLWDKAFDRFALLHQEETMRPSGIDDKEQVEATVNSLCAALHSAATKGAERVEYLFFRGCRFILGFRDIIFWKGGKEWELKPLKDFTPSKEVLNEVVKLLPSVNSIMPGHLKLTEPWNRCSVAAILPAVGREQQNAVIVGDVETRAVMSRERERLLTRLIEHFVDAYSHAINVRKIETRLSIRNRHIQIINSIFDALGGQVVNAGEVIEIAARELRQLGYSRVLFCLVDPKGENIQGVRDDSEDKGIDVAAKTDWPLSEPTADLQPYVIYTRKPKIVEDASREPLANKDIVDQAKMISEAIVPLINPDGDAIGTIHIERSDGAVPSEHEVEDILVFGRQLAIAIQQAERVNLLQAALNKIPEPVVIVDSLKRVRYANRIAGRLLDVLTGWQGKREAQALSSPGTEEIQDSFNEVLEIGHRVVHHFKQIGIKQDYRGAVLIDRIQNWRHQTIGALVHIEDLNYLYRVFDAFRLIGEADDVSSAMQSMLRAMENLGVRWGRLYVVPDHEPNQLVSKLCFGLTMDEEQKRTFTDGKVVLQRHDDPGQTDWVSIDRKTPLAFCWDAERATGEEPISKWGLKAFNLNPPPLPHGIYKKPGDYWIDFPLITAEKILGKICIDCDSNFHPENFEMLKVLSEGVLDAFVRRERQLKQKEKWVQEAADTTVSTTAHNIKSRIATLSALLPDYRSNEADLPALCEINNRFERRLEKVRVAVTRMTERLSPVSLRPTDFDLTALAKRTLTSILPSGTWTLKPESGVEVFADDHLLETALIELIQNSRGLIARIDDLRVSVSIVTDTRGSTDWVKVVYMDNGPGVPTKYKQRIFEQFFSRRPGQGTSTGLGLGFVRRVAEAHGGGIVEMGEEGAGAKFVLEFPRRNNGFKT